MSGFIVAAVLLTLAILALLLTPLLRQKTHASASQRQLNAAIYRDQLEELEGDFQDGGLSEADYRHDREELQRRLLEDAAAADVPLAAASGGNRRTALLLALLLPALAVGLYAWLGTPEALNPTAAVQHNAGSDELERMVSDLAARQEKHPDDLNGWVMLGRSYKAFGRFDEAVKALEHAMPLIEKDAVLLAIYADALAAKSGSLEGKPRQVFEQALKLDPDSPMALDLAGSAAYNRKDFAAAAGYWERQLKQLPPDSDYAKSLAGGIADARAQAASAGIDDIAAPDIKQEPEKKPDSTAGKAVSGTVELDPALKAQAAPGDTLYVFARAVKGSRMPLAALRKKVSDLPLAFSLDDTLAMSPELKLSGAEAVTLDARISKSGDALPHPGDLSGSSAPVKPGAKGVRLRIDRVVP